MNKRTSIVNISGDHEETLIQLSRHLGRSKIRRKVFDTIYGRGTRHRSKKQIMTKAKITDTGTNAQQVQNEIDHLAKHHLIVKTDNNGTVSDGSRYIYGKDETIRANKKKILTFADNPKNTRAIPTKRNPIIQKKASVGNITKKQLKRLKHLNVLYLTSNPNTQEPLRVDEEVRRVQEQIRGSKYRDNITLHYRPAANLNTLLEGLNDLRPQIVHFSGHGNKEEIMTDTGGVGQSNIESLSFELYAKALAATDNPPKVVVLNSCESSGAKKILLPVADIVITMRVSISDIAASVFAQKFYAAIASGQSVKSAFKQGQVAVESASIGESDKPELQHKRNIDPTSMVLT